MSAVAPDLRGMMYRQRRLTQPAETAEFLRRQKAANVGTVDVKGWPYVVPLVYIYEGGDLLYLHTGDHQGHSLANVQNNTRICVEVSEIGDLHPGKPYACNSALVYTSVVVLVRSAFCTVQNPARRNSGPSAALYITDWFLEVYATSRSGAGRAYACHFRCRFPARLSGQSVS